MDNLISKQFIRNCNLKYPDIALKIKYRIHLHDEIDRAYSSVFSPESRDDVTRLVYRYCDQSIWLKWIDCRKRKSGDTILAAHAESGSLKVKIMRFGTASHVQSAPAAAYGQPTNASSVYGNMQHFGSNVASQQHPQFGLGPPPAAPPSFGVQHSLLGGGIQRQPSMDIDARTFKWLPEEGGNGGGRPRGGSLPSYGIESCSLQDHLSHEA